MSAACSKPLLFLGMHSSAEAGRSPEIIREASLGEAVAVLCFLAIFPSPWTGAVLGVRSSLAVPQVGQSPQPSVDGLFCPALGQPSWKTCCDHSKCPEDSCAWRWSGFGELGEHWDEVGELCNTDTRLLSFYHCNCLG